MNRYEMELKRLTFLNGYLRKEIDSTKDMKKKEVLRKRHERVNERLEEHLKQINIEMG